MKKLRIAVLLVTVISLLGLVFACDTGGSSSSPTEVPKVPKLSDYNITPFTDIFVDDDFPTVTVTPKDGFSTGAVTVKYALNNGAPSTSKPSTAAPGSVTVTFDVAAATGWIGIDGFSAGTVIINSKELKIPEFDDFNITGLTNGTQVIKVGDTLTPVIVSPKADKSQGTITYSYTKGGQAVAFTDINKSSGEYDVRFSVAIDNVNKWNAANFRAGTIYVQEKDQEIQVVPIGFSDFDVTLVSPYYEKTTRFTVAENSASPLPSDYSGEAQLVRVTPRTTGNAAGYPINNVGAVTLKFFDVSGATEASIPVPAANKGNYKVNVKIAGFVTDAAAWSEAEFNLWYNINQRTPAATDYVITNLAQAEAGTVLQTTSRVVQHVSIVARPSDPKTDAGGNQLTDSSGNLLWNNPGIASKGAIKIYYEGTSDDESYTADPTLGFTATDVSTGNNPSNTDASKRAPQKAGTYKVYFTVNAPDTATAANNYGSVAATAQDAINWGEATSPKLYAGDLVLAPLVPVKPTFTNFWIDESKDQLTVTSDNILVFTGDDIVFTKTAGPGTVVQWSVDGKKVPNNTTTTLTFSSSATGYHYVTLTVSSGNKLYSQTVEVRVQARPNT